MSQHCQKLKEISIRKIPSALSMQMLQSNKWNGVSRRWTGDSQDITQLWGVFAETRKNPWKHWEQLSAEPQKQLEMMEPNQTNVRRETQLSPWEVMLVSSALCILRLNLTYVEKPRLMKETFSLEFTAFQQPLRLCQPTALPRFPNVKSSFVISQRQTAQTRKCIYILDENGHEPIRFTP